MPAVEKIRRQQLISVDPMYARKIASNQWSGAVAGTGVAGEEYLAAPRWQRIRFTNVSITMTDTGGANGGQGSLKFFDFNAGLVFIEAALSDLAIVAASGITATAAVVGSVGTVAAGAGDATLTSTEANIIPSTTCTLTGSAGVMDGESTTPAMFDGTQTAIDAILNFAVPDAGISANSSLTVNGYIFLRYFLLGDND